MQNIEIDKIKKYSILSWISLNENAKALCINVDDNILDLLKLKNSSVVFDVYQTNMEYSKYSYDYIFAFHIFEKNSQDLLSALFKILKNDGTLFLMSENSDGMRYFCGDATKYDFIYNKQYIKNKLMDTNFVVSNIYSVLPSLEETQMLISENYMINESIVDRYVPTNNMNAKRIVNEAKNFEKLKNKNDFHNKANAYLFVLNKTNIDTSLPLQITLSPDRGVNNFSITTIYSDKVIKLYPFSENTNLLDNNDYLNKRNIKLVDTHYIDGKYIMPYIKDENCLLYFKRILQTDKNKFLEMCDKFYNTLLKSSKVVETNEYGKILERCYFDLIPLNCFVENDEFVFFDQEYYIEKCPINMVMWRTLYLIYNNTNENIVPTKEEMFVRYGINHVEEMIKISSDYLKKLRNLDKNEK